MKKTILSLLFVGALVPSMAQANCDAAAVADAVCETKGETCLSVGGETILACLATAANGTTYKWKATASGATGGGDAGRLYWSGAWTGNKFWCDPGYKVRSFHYDCGCSNNATWFACQKM